MSTPTLHYLAFPDVFQSADANKALTKAQASISDPRIVPAQHLSYEVDSYYLVDGLPTADTSLGINAGAVVESGDFATEGAYPQPFTQDLGATSRWLPLDGTMDDGQSWVPFQYDGPDNRTVLDADGTSPTLDDNYEYLLGAQFALGPAMVMSGGDYFMTDEIGWGVASVTIALVAVLHAPQIDSYGLIETYPPDSVDPNRTFASVRYTIDGAVETHIQGRQAVRQTASQAVRTGQPILVALRIDSPRTVDVVVVDRSLTHWTTTLTDPHPYDARLYLGRSPNLELGTAEMDVLEADYWLGLDAHGMKTMVNELDRLYGVSRG